MLSKSKSKQILKWRYALLIPMISGMLIYSSCAQNTYKKTEISQIVETIKEQLTANSSITDMEKQGLNILQRMVNGTELDKNLLADLQDFTDSESQSDLTKTINKLFEQIQIQGNISNEDADVINSLVNLSAKKGLIGQLTYKDELQEVPFAVIGQVPVYPGCEDMSSTEQRDCMTKKISEFVNKNFNTKLGKENNLVGQQRIIVAFKISKEGNITDVRSRAPHEALAKEAERVVSSLPKMTKPGFHKGKAVDVPYSLPIIFEISAGKE